MDIINKTEFPYFHFEKFGYYGELFSVITLSQTFTIPENDEVCVPATMQREIVMADTWSGEPELSTLHTVSDLVWQKIRADIFLAGSAWHAEGPASQWQAELSVGNLNRKFEVTGPCKWNHSERGWQRSIPEAVLGVQLRHELAPYNKKTNPIGIKHPLLNQSISSTPAPQLSVSVGALCRSWPSRLQYAKGFTKGWQEGVKPFYPNEFDAAFFNSSPPEQQYDGYLQGDEKIDLKGLLKSSSSRTCFLPGLRIIAESFYLNQPLSRQVMLADTLTCHIDEEELTLLWRLTLPTQSLPKTLVLKTEQENLHG